jgi:hypothetical protein
MWLLVLTLKMKTDTFWLQKIIINSSAFKLSHISHPISNYKETYISHTRQREGPEKEINMQESDEWKKRV